MPELPMATIAISFAAGIIAAEFASMTVCALAGAAVYLIGSVMRYFPRAALAVAVAAFLVGAARCAVSTRDAVR